MQITTNQTALVTGANGGIGLAIARALRSRGAKLIVSGRREEPLRAIAEETGARVVVADLGNRSDVTRLIEESGEVDILVANAGVPATGPIVDFTNEQIDQALEVNLRAPMILARQMGGTMAARGIGHVVFISSISGKVATPGSSVYSATKFGLRGFSLGLREDLMARGVGVSTVFPGFIRDAGMFANSGVELPKGMGTKSPEDVAQSVLRAIEENLAELDVAAIEQRAGALLAGLSPALVGWAQRKLGAQAMADKMAAAHKRRAERT